VFESGAAIVVGGITPKNFTKGREILEEMQLSMPDFIRFTASSKVSFGIKSLRPAQGVRNTKAVHTLTMIH